MCVRFSPLTFEEAQAVLSTRNVSNVHALSKSWNTDPGYDARPGSTVPLFVPDENGNLTSVRCEWGFALEGKPHAVFNTRIETALDQLRRGKRGMWTKAIVQGRCLVPVRAFYESHATEKIISEKTGKLIKCQYRFTLPGARAFLLAAIQDQGRFSIVTTEPNAAVAPIHDRMPLVLGSGESGIWLGSGFATLTDRSRLRLDAAPER